MKRVLVSISAGEDQMRSAITEAIAIHRREGARLHLLNVQTTVPTFAARYFSAENLRDIQLQSGIEELAPARAMLDEAKVPYLFHVEIGRTAPTIVRVAQEYDCDRIVMGQPGQPDIVDQLLGSLASQVRQLLAGAGACSVIGA